MLSTITWTVEIMYVHPCTLGLTAFFNTISWKSFSLFHSERPCITPIKWYNCLKCNVHNKFIYHTFSSWRGPLRCRLFDSYCVDTCEQIQTSYCIWLYVPTSGPVEALCRWQMPDSAEKTKNIHNSGKWIHFCDFWSCSTVMSAHCRYYIWNLIA